jgi:monofunctional biosynthetic peptidoglycan transglycosylase
VLSARGRWILGAAATVTTLVAAAAVYSWAMWPDVAALATHQPTRTAFIDEYRSAQRAAGADDHVAWVWVPWDQISVHLERAVVSGEDMEFFSHHGFSTFEMEAALRKALEGGRVRGASTITQQLAKNLWLSPSRNPWRKVKEALLTRSLEHHLTKRRILELYLNVVEFGPGIYGAEAAARHYFDKAAADLTEHESAQLAASLPRPATWHPGVQTRGYERYVAEVEHRMAHATFLWHALGVTPPPGLPVLDSLIIPTPAALDSLPRDTATRVDSVRRDTIHDTIHTTPPDTIHPEPS